MIPEAIQSPSHRSLILLSQLLLPPRNDIVASSLAKKKLKLELQKLCRDDFEDLLMLAQSNRVVVRGLEALLNLVLEEGDTSRVGWAESALTVEYMRIETAIRFLHDVCAAFEEHGYDVTVIKSLDHWPDLGGDLDLYTNASPDGVSNLMSKRFGARIASRSWGDRLAHKWNFIVPGLPEAVEVHMGRLGQTGEQVAFAFSVAKHSRPVFIGGHAFRRAVHFGSCGDFDFAANVSPLLLPVVRCRGYCCCSGGRQHRL